VYYQDIQTKEHEIRRTSGTHGTNVKQTYARGGIRKKTGFKAQEGAKLRVIVNSDETSGLISV
jgi:hypothetical protein